MVHRKQVNLRDSKNIDESKGFKKGAQVMRFYGFGILAFF